MNQRIKWLLLFSIVVTTMVGLFGYISFDTTRKASIEKQLLVLEDLLGDSIGDISHTLLSDGNIDALVERLEAKKQGQVYFYVHNNEGNLQYILSHENDFPNLYMFIGDENSRGQSEIGDKLYTWFNVAVVESPFIITAVYVEAAKTGFSYLNQMGVSLAFATLFIIWLSSWMAIFVANLVRKLSMQRDALEHQSIHDSLTGLPNRNLLLKHLEKAVVLGRRGKKQHALMFIDLNGFKDVNDTLGHFYGDDLLKQIANLLRQAVRDSDTVARIDGDEFGLLLYDTDEFGAEVVAEKIVDQLEKNLLIAHEKFFVSASIGITVYPKDGDDVVALTHNADKALVQAKKSGLNIAFFSGDAEEQHTELKLVSDLRDAIENDALELYYQPKYELQHQTVVSAEALIRWQHPSRGMLPPGRFIDLAERTGLMGRLTIWVMWRAFRDYAIFKDVGQNISVSLNLSVQNLNDPRFVDQVAALVAETEIDPHSFTLEVTESAIVHDAARVSQVLNNLREMGFRVSIDDFGTGYSSFVNFKTLPIDEIKIDRSFVFNAVNSQQDASIIEATINVGKAFGYDVVAEGIENEATVGFLRRMGCNLGQGFHFAKPMEIERFVYWLTRSASRNSSTIKPGKRAAS